MEEDMNKDEPNAWLAEAQIQTDESNSPIAHVWFVGANWKEDLFDFQLYP